MGLPFASNRRARIHENDPSLPLLECHVTNKRPSASAVTGAPIDLPGAVDDELRDQQHCRLVVCFLHELEVILGELRFADVQQQDGVAAKGDSGVAGAIVGGVGDDVGEARPDRGSYHVITNPPFCNAVTLAGKAAFSPTLVESLTWVEAVTGAPSTFMTRYL
jgi:hypothetical protein